MKIIGITGNSGSGKSIASSELNSYNCLVIDLDKIGHKIYSDKNCLDELTDKIKGDYLVDGVVNRKELGKIVFSDYEKLKIFTEIADKYIYNITKTMVEEAKSNREIDFILIDGALILDSKTMELCTDIILICAKPEVRIERVMQRDNITYEDALRRINAQRDYRQYKASNVTIIDNDKDLEEFILNFRSVIDLIVKK